jgi:SecD/SecF fusion protein
MRKAPHGVKTSLGWSIPLTTFIMVAVLYVLGVTSIRDFALPLMVGIVCGTYSSICLAGSMWYVFRVKFVPKVKKEG